MKKVQVKRIVKAASFELRTDFTPERNCTSCGLMYYDSAGTQFMQFDQKNRMWRHLAVTELRFCPMCGKPLRTPKDMLPGYVPEWTS